MALVPVASCTGGADKEAREKALLVSVLKTAKLHDDISKYILETLGVSSVSDFYGLVKESNYEDELVTLIVSKIETQKDNPLMYARIRAAWRAAKNLILKKEKGQVTGTSEDTEEPLDDTVSGELWQSWIDYYHFQLDIFLKPSDNLLGRIYRECQRGQATVIPIKRVQNLAVAALPTTRQQRDLGNNVRLIVDAESDPVMNVYLYYMGLRVLGNAYAITGQHDVPSRAGSGNVRFAPWEVNCMYADSCLRKVMTTPVRQDLQLQWLQSKDELTRTRMVELMRTGWPQGEALTKAIADTEVAWTVLPTQGTNTTAVNDLQPPPPPAGGKGSRKMPHANHDNSGKAICKPWYDPRGRGDSAISDA